jgi:hypothetical protein
LRQRAFKRFNWATVWSFEAGLYDNVTIPEDGSDEKRAAVRKRPEAVLDACVLVPMPVADTLLR